MSETRPPILLDPPELIAKYNLQAEANQYLTLLKEENKKVNLVSRETTDEGALKLFAESILPLEVIGERSFSSYLDIGSGGGFPAIPLLLSKRVSNAVLVERTGKKSTSLGKITGDLGLKVTVIGRNFEDLQFRENFSLITLRYVTLTRIIFSKINRVLTNDGCFIYYSSLVPNLMLSADDSVSCETFHYQVKNDPALLGFTIFKKAKR